MRFKRTILTVILMVMFSSVAYAITSNYLAKYDFDKVRLVPQESSKTQNSNGGSKIIMKPVNISGNVWLRELSDDNLEVIIGSVELTKEQSTGLTEKYIEISGKKGSKMLLSNSFSNNGSYTMDQYWDFKRLDKTSIVKGGNQGDIKSVLLFTKKGEGYTEYFLIGYLNSEVDHWTVGIPDKNYYYTKVAK